MSRTIAVVTGTRADYGLLRWLMHELRNRDGVALKVIATGTHFDPSFGETWHAIRDDGFDIDARVEILNHDDTPLGVALATAEAVRGLAHAFSDLSPDLVVVLGDRYEILAATEAAFLMRIPVAHLHGGEVTQGALDDGIRHAVTKLSALHFVAAEEYAARVRQLGEDPERIFVVGATGLDNFERIDLISATELGDRVGLDLSGDFIMCTQHPETTLDVDPREFAAPLLAALDEFPEVKVIISKANADAGGRALNEVYQQYADAHPHRIALVASLGQYGYLSALTHSVTVVGNSSSGILEAPSAGTPTVNIGDRQTGRLRAPSVIDVDNSAEAIADGIRRAMTPELQQLAARKISPYGRPGVAPKIAEVLATVDLSTLAVKVFRDVPPGPLHAPKVRPSKTNK
jgi:UDP-hydrolysing UDP-N-acetyl-D-glucosamine 2-epimerase